MIWKIARKEILSNILTMRFTVGTVLFLILIVVFTYVLINDHQQKLEDNNELVARNSESFRQLMTYQNLKPTVYKPPEVLSIFCKGVEENINNSARVSIGDVPIIKSASVGGENPLLSIFPVFDIVLIFKIVISILTLLLAYDSISGEKEDRTLGLMLSNGIPRYKILFGKFIGGMITLIAPIAIGFLVGILILIISPMIKLTSLDWLRIFLMLFISLIMVGVLFCLGLFISSTTKRASDTLIFLLFLWVVFVLVIPNASTYIAGWVKPLESRENINAQIQRIWNEYNNEFRDIVSKNRSAGYEIQSDISEPWGYYHYYASKGLVESKQKIFSVSEPLRIEYADKAYQMDRIYLESLKQQKNLADIFSQFSPLSIYEILISKLSRTDMESAEKFYEQTREYRNQIINYLYNKKAFSSIRYFATVKEEYLFDVKDIKEYTILREKYGDKNVFPLTMEDFPQFHYQPEGIVSTIKRILPDTALLVIIGILFFLLAFTAFLRYDVR